MWKRLFKRLDKGFELVEDWALFTAVCMALLTAMANVILRKTTQSFSLYWSDEVVRKVIYFSTYIGCVAAIRERALIRIDAIPQMLPILRKPLTITAHLAVIGFAVMMIYLGFQMTLMMYQDQYARTATLGIPEWYFYAILPIMGFMMVIRTLIVMWEDYHEHQEITAD